MRTRTRRREDENAQGGRKRKRDGEFVGIRVPWILPLPVSLHSLVHSAPGAAPRAPPSIQLGAALSLQRVRLVTSGVQKSGVQTTLQSFVVRVWDRRKSLAAKTHTARKHVALNLYMTPDEALIRCWLRL
ncbi:hypothetical protein JHW43_009608 [Diplocarpon mali]|nr:hypothetical protein JHW43_009608 [Diplocarpon mali]